MALREACNAVKRSRLRPWICRSCLRTLGDRPFASTATASSEPRQEFDDLASHTFALPPSDIEFDPLAISRNRKTQLPSSRYKYRSPRYYRGPLHPHQPPRPSDPTSREFIPGPFTLTRLQQTFESTFESDLMVLAYQHFPFGYVAPPTPPVLRHWDGTSPYHKNRPPRGPIGGVMNLIRKPITWKNVPKITGVTVHSFVKEVVQQKSSAPLHVASMVLQTITGQRCTAHQARANIPGWDLKKKKYVSLTCNLAGEDAHHFVAKLVEVVLPQIREWKGVEGSSGDDNGNITFGLTPDYVAYFPEIEINYDAYPPKMIPGCHITIKTSARSDKDARLLLRALGIPFYGKFVD